MRRQALVQAVSLIPLIALVAACGRRPDSAPPAQAPPTSPVSPAQVYSPPQPERAGDVATEAATLLPAADTPLTYQIRDYGAADFSPVQEFLLREESRAVAVANGRAYAVWEIRPDGVWRSDPRNPATLLRYLPAQMVDGLSWRQRSGDADVWFRLSVASHCSNQVPTCWQVVVLNRGERTEFRFAESTGPISAVVDNWAEPARSFQKYLNPEAGPASLPVAERERLLQGLAAPPPPAPVMEASAAQFADAVFSMLQTARPPLQTIRLDLNGDGYPDVVQGRLDEWTTTPLQFYHPDGSSAGYPLGAGGGRLRITSLPFPGMRLPAFLVERPGGGEFGGVTIVTARENPYMNTWAMEQVYGWAPKADGVIADRVSWAQDGRITVEWDMKDPARHTRVTEYIWFEDRQQKWAGVRRQSVTYRPEGQELRYPPTPKELLQAAFVARWSGLTDELPRYFATPEAAAAFAADKRVSQPDYGPGSVRIGTLTARNQADCMPDVAETDPHGPSPHTFAATWGGYEWCASAWGRVTFAADAQGRPVISDLILEGSAMQGE